MTIKWLTQRELILKRSLNGLALWDYDGAISTSEPIQTEAYKVLLQQNNVEVEDAFFIKYARKSTEQTVTLLKADYQLKPTVTQLIAAKNDIVDELISLNGEPTWILQELISHLTGQGTEIAILSNGKSERISKAWKRWGLAAEPKIYTKDNSKNLKFNKQELESQLIKTGANIVFEGNPANLTQAKKMEAFAVGIRNQSNKLTDDSANLLLDIQGKFQV